MLREEILIVDDDAGFRKLLQTILAGEGYQVSTAATVAQAGDAFLHRQFHLVLSDLRLPDGDGLDVLRAAKAASPATPVIMITGFGTVGSAVEAMKLGAADYLGKPLGSPDELRLLVRNALESSRAEMERDLLREEQQERFGCGMMIADHPSMRHLAGQ